MKRLLHLAALACAFLASPAMACESGNGTRGVALLIGISQYQTSDGSAGWSPLPNAVNDIEYVCDGFAKAGYRLIVVKDAEWASLDAAIADFHLAAFDAPSAIIYYAGHGFEYDGKQYLVPAGAPQNAPPERLQATFMPLNRVLSAASEARDFSLFLMDACRTLEPVVEIGATGRKLPATIDDFEVPSGAVIFSTTAGRPAFDDAPVGSPQSPFAKAVAQNLKVPGLDLSDFYDNLHRDMVDLTEQMKPKGPQYPALYKRRPGRFYLVEAPDEQALAKAASDPAPVVALDLPDMAEIAVTDGPRIVGKVLQRHSLADLLRAAKAGDAVAQYIVGVAYQQGIGTRQDTGKARDWLEQSAAQGNEAGTTALGYMLLSGRDADRDRALALFRAASDAGYAKARSQLAYQLWDGTPGHANAAEAIDLYQRASDAGHVFATYSLAQYVPARREAAIARLRELAASGEEEGDNWLCEIAYVDQNVGAAATHCEKAALEGYPAARAIWAGMLARGDGVTRNTKQARYWARLALSELDKDTRKALYDYTARYLD